MTVALSLPPDFAYCPFRAVIGGPKSIGAQKQALRRACEVRFLHNLLVPNLYNPQLTN